MTKSNDSIPTRFPPCRVLVADDEHLVATGLANNLRDLGHEVVAVASDGESTVSLARQHKPNLALLDIRMPVMCGTEVAMLLLEELNIPSIIVSAYSDGEYIDRIHGYGMSSGVYGYLLKPVGKEDLRVMIGVVMQRASVDLFHSGRIDQLERNLVNRRMVEQAKWKLVEKLGITEPDAHERLQKLARDKRQPLVDIARGVVESGDLLG